MSEVSAWVARQTASAIAGTASIGLRSSILRRGGSRRGSDDNVGRLARKAGDARWLEKLIEGGLDLAHNSLRPYAAGRSERPRTAGPLDLGETAARPIVKRPSTA